MLAWKLCPGPDIMLPGFVLDVVSIPAISAYVFGFGAVLSYQGPSASLCLLLMARHFKFHNAS